MAQRIVLKRHWDEIINDVISDTFDYEDYEKKWISRRPGLAPGEGEVALINEYERMKREILIMIITYNLEDKVNGLGVNYGTTLTQSEYEKAAENYRLIDTRISHWNDTDNTF